MIAELESEKATFEVNAEKAGTLKTVAKEGDTLNIGDTLAQIDESAAKPEAKAQAGNGKQEAGSSNESKVPQPQTPNSKPQTPNAQSSDVKATPLASALIADKKVDPKNIQPSGYNGKILREDVMEALSNPGRKPGLQPFNREG